MDRLIFTANAAVKEQAVARQALVNELANVATTGFKRALDTALRSVKIEGDGFDTRYQAQTVTRDVIDLTPGAVMVTGNPLDVALQGQAVLGVQADNGELAFTRRGDLRLNVQGQLQTAAGQLVLGQGGEPITAPPGFLLSITADGTLFAADPAQPQAPAVFIDQLMLRDASQVNLGRRTDGLFRVEGQPDGSDFPTGPDLPRLIPQALEGSNVNAIYAMTRLIDHSRTFEAQIRAIKEAKGIDENGSSLMKLA
jgi:flagellar basal-body rod protein FlgF